MIRKMMNKNYIFSRLASVRSFWKLRHRLRWLNFELEKANFTIKDKLNDTKDSISVIRTISVSALPSVVIALAVVVALYFLELHIDYIKQLPLMNDVASWVSF